MLNRKAKKNLSVLFFNFVYSVSIWRKQSWGLRLRGRFIFWISSLDFFMIWPNSFLPWIFKTQCLRKLYVREILGACFKSNITHYTNSIQYFYVTSSINRDTPLYIFVFYFHPSSQIRHHGKKITRKTPFSNTQNALKVVKDWSVKRKNSISTCSFGGTNVFLWHFWGWKFEKQ